MREFPGFDKYDIVHVGISGGKDSQASYTWLRFDSGCPIDKIRASFCDTGNEHEWTYEHIEYMRQEIGPIETIKAELDFYQLAEKKRRFPSAKTRFCTEYLKMQPSQRHIKQWMVEGKNILLITGVRRGESKARSELAQFDFDTYYACDIYRPLIDWTTEQVFKYLKSKGQHANPLYSVGARRVGCFPCIMSNKREMRIIADKFPERIDKIREAEKKVRDGAGSTFFASGQIPAAFNTGKFHNMHGEEFNVPTIDDVVKWAHTSRGGKQFEFDFDEFPTYANNSGACE